MPEDPVKGFAEQLLKSGFLSGKSSLEKFKSAKLENKNENFKQTLYDSTVDFNPQIGNAIQVSNANAKNQISEFWIIFSHLLSSIRWILPGCSSSVAIRSVFTNQKSCHHLHQVRKVEILQLCYTSLIDFQMLLGYATKSDPSSWTEFIEVQKEQFYGAFID